MNDLLDTLKTNIVIVTFIKVDGTERKMKCTQNLSMIPVESHPINPIVDDSEVIRVWDFESTGWRSFRKDSVISWHRDGEAL